MMKSKCLFALTVVVGALSAAMAVAGDAEAQMRTRKGEYYEGVQRKPYGHYWIWPPVEQREQVYRPRPGKDGAASERPKPSKRPVQ